MPKIAECQSSRSEITELKVLNDNLVAFSSRIHGINVFSATDCSAKLRINRVHEHLNSSTAATAFSPNAQFLAFAVKKLIYIFHMPSRIVVKTIHADNEDVSLLSFDSESKYIIVGTTSGRVLQYRYDGSSLLSRLCSFNDNANQSAVSAFAFYKNRLACASNNGDIYVVDLHSRANKVLISNTKVKVTSLCFVNEKVVISAHENGKIFINDIESQKLIKQIDTNFTTISTILLMPNPNYILINGNTNYVTIFDIKRYKIAHHKYITFKDEVEKIVLAENNTLIVALKNMHVYRVELPSVAKLKSLVLHNALDEAFNMCERDSMIKDTKEYEKLVQSYEKIYAEAIGALINQQKKLALGLVEPFLHVNSKKEEIKLLFKGFENYPKLQSLFMEKKFAPAYALCTQYPALQHTFQYKKMEELWKEAFKNAQRQFITGRDEIAKLALNEFVTVLSKQPIIKLVLNHNKKFIEFLQAIENKNFQKVYEIAKTNEAFTQIPTYKTLGIDIEENLNKIEEQIKNGDVAPAKEALKKYENLSFIAPLVAKLKQNCQNVANLEKAYHADDFNLCYELMDKDSSLSFTKTGLVLEEHWIKIVHEAEGYALKGNIKDIKATLGKLIHLKTRRAKIGDLLRVSFHTKIKALIAKGSFKNAESIIYSYIDIFGLDTDITSIMRAYESKSKLKLAITQAERQTRDGWVNSKIIMGS